MSKNRWSVIPWARSMPFALMGFLLMGAECPPAPDGMNPMGGNPGGNPDDGVDTSGIPDDNAIGFASALVIGSDIPNGSFFVFNDAKNVNGSVSPAYTASLQTSFAGGMNLTAAGSLLIMGDSTLLFDSRASIEAGTFDRQINSVHNVIAHAMDRVNDRLFLASNLTDGYVIQMIQNISDKTLNGQVPPTHVFSSPAFATRGIDSMCVATDGRLYVVTKKGTEAGPVVLVFPNAHELEGKNVSAEHTISFTEYYSDNNNVPGRIIQPVVDKDDNLIFIAGRNASGTGEIGFASIAHASQLDGNVTGTHFLKAKSGNPLKLAVIDGAAYGVTFGKVEVYNNIVGREGNPEPDRQFTVQGLNQPRGLVAFE